jgi:hypothetical protein
MPYWSIYCIYCQGYIADALLECLPAMKRSTISYQLLFRRCPGAALACPYCNVPIGFDATGLPQVAPSGWPIFRYGRKELELKKTADGEPKSVSLTDWALQHRFTQPGAHAPFSDYHYAEDAPSDEIVP